MAEIIPLIADATNTPPPFHVEGDLREQQAEWARAIVRELEAMGIGVPHYDDPGFAKELGKSLLDTQHERIKELLKVYGIVAYAIWHGESFALARRLGDQLNRWVRTNVNVPGLALEALYGYPRQLASGRGKIILLATAKKFTVAELVSYVTSRGLDAAVIQARHDLKTLRTAHSDHPPTDDENTNAAAGDDHTAAPSGNPTEQTDTDGESSRHSATAVYDPVVEPPETTPEKGGLADRENAPALLLNVAAVILAAFQKLPDGHYEIKSVVRKSGSDFDMEFARIDDSYVHNIRFACWANFPISGFGAISAAAKQQFTEEVASTVGFAPTGPAGGADND